MRKLIVKMHLRNGSVQQKRMTREAWDAYVDEHPALESTNVAFYTAWSVKKHKWSGSERWSFEGGLTEGDMKLYAFWDKGRTVPVVTAVPVTMCTPDNLLERR